MSAYESDIDGVTSPEAVEVDIPPGSFWSLVLWAQGPCVAESQTTSTPAKLFTLVGHADISQERIGHARVV